MKRIEYKFESIQQELTENGVENITVLKTRSIPYSAQNEEITKTTSADGNYVIYDDGEPEPPPTTEQRVSDLEEQLTQSDETAIALYEAQETQEVINAQQDEALMEIYEMIG